MDHSQSQLLIGILAFAVILSPFVGVLVNVIKKEKRNTNLLPQDVKPSDVPALKDFPFTKFYYGLDFSAPFKKLFTRDKDSLGTLDVRDQSGNSIGKVFVANKYRFSVESHSMVIECDYKFKKFTEMLEYLKFFTTHDNKNIMTVNSSYDLGSGPFEFSLNGRTFKLSSISYTKKIFDIEENGQVIGRICCATWSQYVLGVFSKDMDDLGICFIFGIYGRMGR